MRITFSSLDSISCRSHEITSEYHMPWPWRCLPYAKFENENDFGLQNQDHTKSVIIKIKIKSLNLCELEDQDRARICSLVIMT